MIQPARRPVAVVTEAAHFVAKQPASDYDATPVIGRGIAPP